MGGEVGGGGGKMEGKEEWKNLKSYHRSEKGRVSERLTRPRLI